MSKHSREKIKCPKCGKESDFMVWQSINTTLDPDMKEKVRTGEAFLFTCPDCGEKTSVFYTTLYHQMEDHVMIQLNLGGNIEESIEFMKGIFRNDKGEVVDFDIKLDEDYQNRVVTDMNSFREKLMILDAGLDDKVIELMKLFMRSHLQENNPELEIEEFLFEINGDGEKEFALHLSDGKWGTTDYAQGLYDMIEKEFANYIAQDKEVVIDINWALDAFRANNNG